MTLPGYNQLATAKATFLWGFLLMGISGLAGTNIEIWEAIAKDGCSLTPNMIKNNGEPVVRGSAGGWLPSYVSAQLPTRLLPLPGRRTTSNR